MANITERHDTLFQQGKVLSYPMAAVEIFEGALVSVNSSGYATNASDTSGDVNVGVAHETVDNSGGSAGDKEVQVRTHGVHEFDAGFTASQGNVGDLVYASDNQTVNIAGNLTNDVLVGRVERFVDSGTVRVKLLDPTA